MKAEMLLTQLRCDDKNDLGCAPYASPIVTLNQARQDGLKRYFTGKPCSNGHISERNVADQKCMMCASARARARRAADPKKFSEQRKARHAANPEKRREQQRRHRADNNEKYRERDRKRHLANREKCLERRRAHYNRDRDKLLEQKRTHYAINLEKSREQNRARHAANPQKRREQSRRWAAANKEKRRVSHQRRRAHMRGAEGFFTAEDVERIHAEQKGRCAYYGHCGNLIGPRKTSTRERQHRDHIISLAAGGTNWPRNIQLTCGSCNMKKKATDPIDFAQRIGLLI